MNSLNDWAERNLVSAHALAELMHILGAPEPDRRGAKDGSEAAAVALVRLDAGRRGIRLWRNNVGAGHLKDGSFIRWGLANESAAMNAVFKSSDMIGIAPDGRFVAREVKHAGWHYGGTPREVAQLRFIQLINSLGGDAAFATGEGSFK